MIRINANYLKLKSSYLFSDIAKKVSEYQKKNPEKEIIKLGIGDVTQPLPKVCIEAFHKAIDEMGDIKTFKGYGPEQGYDFLRNAVAEYDFKKNNVDVNSDEIFISDGSKCDIGNFQELFDSKIKIGIPDPVYPVYVDTNVMAGRTGKNINDRYKGLYYLESRESNNFIPSIPKQKLDLIYLCFPNNPTGAVAEKENLAEWVAYAKKNKALILFDAAYAEFIRDKSIPKSIFEIQGAREVAVEFRSFSKTAGFTGTRCAYTVIPKECSAWNKNEKVFIHSLWNRRHTTKFNGVSYPVQKAASAIFSPEGRKQVKELIDYYMANASLIKNGIKEIGYKCYGGDNGPYIWVKTDLDSWQAFDLLLEKAGVVTTPGSGFGTCGQGYIRISAFNNKENVIKAMDKIKLALK